MKKLITLLFILITLVSLAQSFSDYKEYVLDNEYFKVKSRKTNSQFINNQIYYCKVVREHKLESGYLFIVTDGKNLTVKMNEDNFMKQFKSVDFEENKKLEYICDNQRHLICIPYNIDNLHKMAQDLNINKCWYHGGKYPHYDIPKKRITEIKSQCNVIESKALLKIIKINI
jgi:hypothetical protein